MTHSSFELCVRYMVQGCSVEDGLNGAGTGETV
jgi:hypothetical protein